MMPPIVDVEPNPEPLDRGEFDAGVLMRQHQPVIRDPNKLVVFRIACPDCTSERFEEHRRKLEAELRIPIRVVLRQALVRLFVAHLAEIGVAE
jgi:hypothetical protein